MLTVLTRWSTGPGPIDRFIGIEIFKEASRFKFSIVLLHFFRVFLILVSKDDFEQGLDRLKALEWIFGKIRGSGFSFGPHFPSPARHSQFLLHFRVLRVSIVLVSLSTSPFSSVSPFLMAPMRESIASRA